MRLVDLTQPLSASAHPYPGHPPFSADVLQTWPRDRLNTYVVTTSMHTGTHIDAPLHMAPRGWSVGDIPLDRLCGSAVIVDLRDRVGDWTVVTRESVEVAAPDEIRAGDIVILYYGWSRYAGGGDQADMEKFFCLHPGPDVELVDWLIDKGIKWIGTDAPSFEHPFNISVQQQRPDLVRAYEERTGEVAAERFPDRHRMYAHLTMGRHNIMHVDQLGGDLAAVAGRRLDVGVFPWRWSGGDASIVRAVAFDAGG